jgi:hypothetical protein
MKTGKQNKGKPSSMGMLGKCHSVKTKEKMSEAHANSKSYSWKGNGAGYRAKHKWITRVKGKPTECFVCGKKVGRLHWANIDHQYKREESEYISMCPKCHGHYDKINGLRKHK